MHVFRTVVDQGAFTRAARRLRLSNAAVSKHVAALEEALGTRLLHRTTRSLSLTSAGTAYYQRATRLLDELDQLERDVRAERDEPSGVLRIAAPMSFGVARLGPALPAFLAANPKVELDLSLTDRFVDVVEEGVDVAIRIAASLPDSSLVATKLGTVQRVLVGSPKYLRARGRPRMPSDLESHACLRYTRSDAPSLWTFRGPDGDVAVRVSGPLSSDNSLAMRASLVAGIGLALTPEFVVEEDVRAKRLVRCLEGWEPEPRTVYAVHPASRHLSAKVRAFVAFAKRTLVDEGVAAKR